MTLCGYLISVKFPVVKSRCSALRVAAAEEQGGIQCNGKATNLKPIQGTQLKSRCNQFLDINTTGSHRGLKRIKNEAEYFWGYAEGVKK